MRHVFLMTQMVKKPQETNRKSSPIPRHDPKITMSNALIRAGHGLTLAEKRIVMLAVSKLDSRAPAPPSLSLQLRTKITAAEYAETFSVDANTAYEALQDAAKNLFERKITFFEPAYTRAGLPLKPIRNDMRWVGRCKYHEHAGWVELSWWPDLLPSLMGLKKQFTTYNLQQANALRSAYSWRLLELMMHYKDSGKAEYTIEDFCTSMDATEKQKSNFNNIKRRIIEPAVKELTEKDGWIIQWEPIKTGRKVTRIRFYFSKNQQYELIINNKNKY